jgi:methyl-accepting chemotaxis protein
MSRHRPRRLRAFAVHVVIAGAAFAFVAALAAGFALLLRWAVALQSAEAPQSALAATREILALHEAFWVSLAVSLLAVCVAASWLGRHITGPLQRFVGEFRELAAGRPPRAFQIRATDYLADELDAFNAMATALADRARARTQVAAELHGELEALADAARGRGDAAALAALARAAELAKQLAGTP